jgi:hypothetical protein
MVDITGIYQDKLTQNSYIIKNDYSGIQEDSRNPENWRACKAAEDTDLKVAYKCSI